jgi:hypothetical protein
MHSARSRSALERAAAAAARVDRNAKRMTLLLELSYRKIKSSVGSL